MALVRAAVDRLTELGAIAEECSLPNTDYALAAYYIIAPAECSSNLSQGDASWRVSACLYRPHGRWSNTHLSCEFGLPVCLAFSKFLYSLSHCCHNSILTSCQFRLPMIAATRTVS